MRVIDEYSNIKIYEDPNRNLPIYRYVPPEFTEKEEELLKKFDQYITETELDTVRRETDPTIRKQILHQYLKEKLPKIGNIDTIAKYMVDYVIGYGELTPLIEDEHLEEIMVNGVNLPVIVFHKKYGMCLSNIHFKDRERIYRIINRICLVHNKKLNPVIDISSIDGHRINITQEPLTIHGPSMTIRKQRKHFYTISELIALGTLDVDLAALLWLAVDGYRLNPANILIAGSVGSGKTTTLNAMTMFVPPEYRVVTIEDTPELDLSFRENWVPLQCSTEYDMNALLMDTLRMRPDLIIVGEIRGSEAMSLFNAMNVGHKSLGTVHASSPREVVYRLESPPMNVAKKIIANLDLILVQNKFMYHGTTVRRITEVVEVGGVEGENVLLGTIYKWDPKHDRSVKEEQMMPTTFLDKLSKTIKIKKTRIMDSLNERKLILEGLLNEKIYDYNRVSRRINDYYQGELGLEKSISELASQGAISKKFKDVVKT